MLIFVNNPTWVMLQRVESDFTRIPKVKVVALHYIYFFFSPVSIQKTLQKSNQFLVVTTSTADLIIALLKSVYK